MEWGKLGLWSGVSWGEGCVIHVQIRPTVVIKGTIRVSVRCVGNILGNIMVELVVKGGLSVPRRACVRVGIRVTG